MSEFRQEWPQTSNMQDHLEYIQEGLAIINNRLLLPKDGRWDIAYGALVMGGQDAAVFAEGQPGAGKTAFGNIVFGEDMRVDIASTDTAETLEGYESPVDHKFVQPKMHLDAEDMRIFLNELSHLRDTGPLHKYWDGEELIVNGNRYDLTNASIYSTANFPDGGRSKKIDPALRSRMGITVLAGDNGREIAAQLHGMEGGEPINESLRDGLLPISKYRTGIRNTMAKYAPNSPIAGQYIANVLESISANGLLQSVDLTDKRTSNGWIQAVRAHRIVTAREITAGPITPENLALVAGLALGSIAVLSSSGSRLFTDVLPKKELSKLDKAVLARRVVAGIAMNEVMKMRDMSRVDISKDEEIARFIDRRSYASLGENAKSDELIVNTIVGSKVKGSQDEQAQSKRRSFFFRSR